MSTDKHKHGLIQEVKEEIEDFAVSLLPSHHNKATKAGVSGRFDNPWPTWEDRSFFDVFRWNRERRKLGLPRTGHLIGNLSPSKEDFLNAFQPVTPDAAALANPPADAVQATWIGHATVLVQLQGLTFLTDPVFAHRCSPLSFAGPERVVPPALTPTSNALPHIDAVLLSHNHYDHLCDRSVKALFKRFGSDLKWFLPLGLAPWFQKRGIHNVVELDWWGELEYKGVKVVFTPAQHWSMRGIFDRKSTLWGSWAVVGKNLKFWFAGDTGYCPAVFNSIGDKLGPFDLAAIPTGAYSPRWFMKPQHIGPEEAVLVHREVQSKRSIAIHCATWCLTDEPMDEPILLLKKYAEEAGLDENEFVTLRHGAHVATAAGVDLNTPKVMPMPRGAAELVANGIEYVPSL